MGRRKISTTIYITDEQDRALRALNGVTKVSMSEYIRQGIDKILDEHRGLLPAVLPRRVRPRRRVSHG